MFLYLVKSEQIKKLLCSHALQACIFLADHCICNIHFELLKTHDLLFQSSPGYQAIHINNTFLKEKKHTQLKSIILGYSGKHFHGQSGGSLAWSYPSVTVLSLTDIRWKAQDYATIQQRHLQLRLYSRRIHCFLQLQGKTNSSHSCPVQAPEKDKPVGCPFRSLSHSSVISSSTEV